ncbi:MAG: hypothetical protein JSV24_10590 [Bacteroidales bacterium]|nr:MAG: hypothetical protein JSV24_10590 [Bacteroidales bacterium]
MNICKIYLFSIICIGLLSCSKVDTADDVINEYIKILGGQSVIDSIKTLFIKASYFYPNTNDEFKALYYWKYPNFSRFELNREQKQIIAYNGKKAWTASIELTTGILTSSTELPDSNPVALNFKRTPGIESFIGGPPQDYKNMGINAVLLGKDTIDGVTAHHLKLTWDDGFEKEYFFNVKNGYFIFEKVKDQRGLIHTSTFMDYEEIGGLYLSCFRLNKGPSINNNQIIVHQRIVDLNINMRLPDSLFVRPENQ